MNRFDRVTSILIQLQTRKIVRAKDIADRFKIDPRRSASLLDIFSCFVQGIIPYGAQLLMAAGLGHVSPIEIMQYLYYPYLLGVGALLAITFNYPRKYAGDC